MAWDERRKDFLNRRGGEIFPVKERFGRTIVTVLARVGADVVGFVANQPMHRAGACDADGCDKAVSFIVRCDSFNIPLIFRHDVPGFFIGRDAERKRVAAKIINWREALGQVTVPRISVIVRKTYGRSGSSTRCRTAPPGAISFTK